MQEQDRYREERHEGHNGRQYRRSEGDDSRRERERDRQESSRYEAGGEWEPDYPERHRPSWQQPAQIYGQRRDQEFGTQQQPSRAPYAEYGQGYQGGQRGDWQQAERGRGEWRDYERSRDAGSYSTGQGGYGQGSSSYGQWSGGYGQRGQSEFGRPDEWRGQSGYGPSGHGQRDERSQGGQAQESWRRTSGWDQRPYDQAAGSFGARPSERFAERGESRFDGPHMGRGPKGYTRSKERILDDVNQALQDDSWLDASEIDVQCEAGEVVLRGTVSSRQDKRRAEECAERISGVKDVRNEIRVKSENESAMKSSSKAQSSSGRTTSSNPT